MFRAATDIACSDYRCPNLATTTLKGKPLCRSCSEKIQARSMRINVTEFKAALATDHPADLTAERRLKSRYSMLDA